MKIKFKKEGKVALNYGVAGVIDVKEGEEKDILDAYALILVEKGIAVQVIADEKPVVELPPEVDASEEVTEEVIAEVTEELKPKKRGRKKKAD